MLVFTVASVQIQGVRVWLGGRTAPREFLVSPRWRPEGWLQKTWLLKSRVQVSPLSSMSKVTETGTSRPAGGKRPIRAARHTFRLSLRVTWPRPPARSDAAKSWSARTFAGKWSNTTPITRRCLKRIDGIDLQSWRQYCELCRDVTVPVKDGALSAEACRGGLRASPNTAGDDDRAGLRLAQQSRDAPTECPAATDNQDARHGRNRSICCGAGTRQSAWRPNQR